MNILILVDKKKSAIALLAGLIKRYSPHHHITIQSFHPKRPDLDELENAPKLWEAADIVHVAYWKSGDKFKEMYPQLFASKRKILTHYNPYNVYERDWKEDYKRIIVPNNEMEEKIPYAKKIPMCIDLHFWEYNRDYTDSKAVLMVAGRIEGKKGIKEVAITCKNLGVPFNLVGRVSKGAYVNEVLQANPDTKFLENATDEQLRDMYYQSALYVCNSIDNFESGPLPVLEAMACGVPVISRLVGHVPELYNGGNMVLHTGNPEAVDELEKIIGDTLSSKPLRNNLREKAWWTVKNRNAEKMAREFSGVYYAVGNKSDLVSIITPTFDKPDILLKNLAASIAQDYANKEIIVVDSGNESVEPLVEEFRKQTKVPVKYIRFENNGEYTLPKARNMAIIESEGRYLCFCDERIAMEKTAVTEFMKYTQRKTWLYGMKNEVEKGFVENFSFIARDEIIKLGMFNERVDAYGGASQELRERFGRNEVLFECIASAKANTIAGSKNKYNKKKDIIKAKYTCWKLYGKA